MKYLKLIYLSACTLALATACTKNHPFIEGGDEAIRFGAGIAQDVIMTKGVPDPDANHAKHTLFTVNTVAAVRMYGEWTHTPAATPVVTQVVKYTTATMKAETSSGSRHNGVETSPVLFWDDFGSADAENTAGRERGLDIYAAAVNGVTTAPSIANDAAWSNLDWNLPLDQKTGGWAAMDLLTSNNIRWNATPAQSNSYRFADRANYKLMEFTHAMSKVTVNITAGEGFPIVGGQFCFEGDPEVLLTGFKYQGSVNILNKVSTPSETTGNIIPRTIPGGTKHESSYDALVYPGNSFANDFNILKIAVDGNIYYVNATSLNTKMTAVDGSTTFIQGKNYILNVVLKKTEIKVTATIKDWDDVNSAEVTPEINVSAGQGTSGSAIGDGFDGFSFYRSSTAHTDAEMNTGYSAGIDPVNGFTPAEAVAVKPASDPTTTKWAFQTLGGVSTKLFWPTHGTHYQFRGVWPLTVTDEIPVDTKPAAPHVQTVDSKQVISIYNTAYAAGAYPSDLLIGRPEFENPGTETCHNSDHTARNLYTYGICATTGLVNLNFRYMMSQVEVVLSSTDPGEVDHVQIGENTVVEIVNGYIDGYVGLGDRVVTVNGETSSYTLDKVAGEGNELKRHSAIVPQALTFSTAGAETNLRFKITVTNSDNTTDIYFADINPIKKNGSEDLVARNGRWESGVHYVYNLKIKKTEISVTATVTDWITVNAEDDIWF